MKGKHKKQLRSCVTLLEKIRHMNSGKENSIRRLQNLNTIDSRRKHREKKAKSASSLADVIEEAYRNR